MYADGDDPQLFMYNFCKRIFAREKGVISLEVESLDYSRVEISHNIFEEIYSLGSAILSLILYDTKTY